MMRGWRPIALLPWSRLSLPGRCSASISTRARGPIESSMNIERRRYAVGALEELGLLDADVGALTLDRLDRVPAGERGGRELACLT